MNISNSDTDVLECDYSHYKMEVSPTPKSLPHIHCGFHEVADFPNAFEGGSGLQNNVLGRYLLWFLLGRKCLSFYMSVLVVHSQRHVSGLLQCTMYSWDDSCFKYPWVAMDNGSSNRKKKKRKGWNQLRVDGLELEFC